MNVLLVYLNPIDDTHPMIRPYGLEIIKQSIKNKYPKAHVQITNPFFQKRQKSYLKKLIKDTEPDLIGLSIRNIDNALTLIKNSKQTQLYTHNYLIKATPLIETIKLVSNAPIVIGGSGFSVDARSMLKYFNLHIGITGPGEESFLKICELVKSQCFSVTKLKNSLKKYPGLTLRQSNRFYQNKTTSNNIDKPNNVYRDEEQNTLYSFFKNSFFPVRYSAGCPKKCSYCVEHVNLNRVVHRRTDDIIQEIKFINKTHGANNIWLTASEINFHQEPLKQLCKQIIKNKLHLKNRFRAYFYCKPFSVELYYLLQDAGFDYLHFTIAHTNNALLKRNGQHVRKEDLLRTIDIVQNEGSLPFNLGFLLGQPGETTDTLDELIQDIKMIDDTSPQGLDFVYSCGVRAYPNTPVAKECLRLGFSHPYVIGKDKQFIDTVLYSSPFPPHQICTYFEKKMSQLSLKGNRRLMNSNVILPKPLRKEYIELQKCLGRAESPKQALNSAEFKIASKSLKKDSHFKNLIKDFTK